MNKEDIIRMARQSRIDVYGLGVDYAKFDAALKRFAALVAEDCAKVADQAEPYQSADLIRARWQA